MRLSKRALDALGRLGAGKDKPKIPGPLRKGYQVLPRMGGDGNLVDPENGPRLHLAADLLQDPCPPDRNHHHTCRPPLARERRDPHAEGMAKDQLLQRKACAEAERAGAQSPDRTGGHLDDRWALAVDAQLGMHGPIPKAQRLGRPRGAGGDLRLNGDRETRRGDVDGFLEKRAIEGIRFVKEGQYVEFAPHQQALKGHLPPRNKRLYKDLSGDVAQGRSIRGAKDLLQPPDRADELAFIVRADDAATRR